MDIVREYIRKVVFANARDEARQERAKREFEENGGRIVDGGQTDTGWEVTDYRTGELLASGNANDGTGDLDSYQSVWDELGSQWRHIDTFWDDGPEEVEPLASMSLGLASNLAVAVDGAFGCYRKGRTIDLVLLTGWSEKELAKQIESAGRLE